MTTPLHRFTLTEIAGLVARGEVSARAVTEDALARCQALNSTNRALITLMADEALAAADAADLAFSENRLLGPLHGVPITIKDIFDIAGQPTTAGMPVRAGHVATVTSTVVERIASAGGIVIGKANVAEGVFGNYLEPFGAPVNPWNAGYWGGASSGGSAVAVAAEMGYGSIGSDTGGSIRMPCAVNGVTGLKPTWGRVSRHAVFELAGTLDHMGTIGHTAEDVARMFAVIAGRDERDPTALLDPVEDPVAGLGGGVAGLVIGRPVNWLDTRVDPQLLAALDAALSVFADLGARIIDLEMPDDTGLVADWYDVETVQTAVAHEDIFSHHAETYSDALAAAIRHGRDMPAPMLQKAQTRRADFTGRLKRCLEKVDAVLLPVLPFTAPTNAELDGMDQETIFALHRFACPFTMSGAPALAFPAGRDRDGLPLGLQLAGPHLGEALLLRAVHAFQGQTGHHKRRPPLEV